MMTMKVYDDGGINLKNGTPHWTVPVFFDRKLYVSSKALVESRGLDGGDISTAIRRGVGPLAGKVRQATAEEILRRWPNTEVIEGGNNPRPGHCSGGPTIDDGADFVVSGRTKRGVEYMRLDNGAMVRQAAVGYQVKTEGKRGWSTAIFHDGRVLDTDQVAKALVVRRKSVFMLLVRGQHGLRRATLSEIIDSYSPTHRPPSSDGPDDGFVVNETSKKGTEIMRLADGTGVRRSPSVPGVFLIMGPRGNWTGAYVYNGRVMDTASAARELGVRKNYVGTIADQGKRGVRRATLDEIIRAHETTPKMPAVSKEVASEPPVASEPSAFWAHVWPDGAVTVRSGNFIMTRQMLDEVPKEMQAVVKWD